jgi:hypothetical protein
VGRTVKLDSVQLSPAPSEMSKLRRLPSEYMAENVWLGNSFASRKEAVAAIEIGRDDRY